jgi:hypothetical protein
MLPAASNLIRITTAAEVDEWLGHILCSAQNTVAAFRDFSTDPLAALYRLKFEKIGFHPVDHRPLNVIEQINQTWTFVVALEAARLLLNLHIDASPLLFAPGAHASQPLDIMSERPGLIGAETFAATTPESNSKIGRDLRKMAARGDTFRYIFFMSPAYPERRRIDRYCQYGVDVWSVGRPVFAQLPNATQSHD